jgi:hypothetical protein
MAHIIVFINGLRCSAELLYTYPDGDVKVRWGGRVYVVRKDQIASEVPE